MAQPLSPNATNSSKLTTIFSSLPLSSLTLLLAILLCLLGLHTLLQPTTTTTPNHRTYNTQNALHFQDLFLSSSTNYTISLYLRQLTLHPHLAGTSSSVQTLQYVQSHFKSLNLETHTTNFSALLSYPNHTSISLHFPNGSSIELSLTEPGQSGRVVQPYHAYSPSGSVVSKPVFVNYGREEDYRALKKLGVDVKGCLVVARRGEIPRRGVVAKAEENGAVAVLIYADGDRFNGVERGTVMNGLGDPLTPGWAGGEKLGLDDKEVLKRFPKIPSLPLSAENAEIILRSLEGVQVPLEWKGTLQSKVASVGVGPSLVKFSNQEEKKVVDIHNIFAVIRGWEEPDRYILLGNHRDAWTYGAVDPNSGTAVMLDIARRYSLLMRLGWVPRRTIILCSWDAEEFGMVGSTEWVEQNLVNLRSKAAVYLNVDCAVQGPGFFARATPQLDNLLIEVTKKIKDPDSKSKEVFQTWAATDRGINIQRLSEVDSDFAPFLQHAGVPSLDLYYGKDFPVYHTAFDSFEWMTTYGDPLFHRHVAVAGIWGLLALRLADDPILPFNYLSYAERLQEHTDSLHGFIDANISLHPITSSIQDFASEARRIEEQAKKLREEVITDDLLELKRRSLNDQLMLAERGFLDAEGLQGRQWFKHVVYGPPKEYESKLGFFPGVADAISEAEKMAASEAQSAVQHEIWKVARAIQRAGAALKGELT